MAKPIKEIIVLGGGCFWCTEAVFKDVRGVLNVVPGYAGGNTLNPNYEDVCTGSTNHAEVIRVEYNSTLISAENILKVFFASHDYTQVNRQGNDVGTQYRSIILYTTEKQKTAAENFVKNLNDEAGPASAVATEIKQLPKDGEVGGFTIAEISQQDYFALHKTAPYCQIVIAPKLEKLQKEIAPLLWSTTLTSEQYRILREAGTEAPFSGKNIEADPSGVYRCAGCKNELFEAGTKFDSDCGWPSFDKAIEGTVLLLEDNSLGMTRTEVRCAFCGSHLGHLFNDGPTSTGLRYCINAFGLE
ncbi:MAG: peptide-methionine (S)-S-oxide reductase MsrA [bacterium]